MKLVDLKKGVSTATVESVQVESENILDIDISRQFVKQLTEMIIKVLNLIGSLDELDGIKRIFDISLPEMLKNRENIEPVEDEMLLNVLNLCGTNVLVETESLAHGQAVHVPLSNNVTAIAVEFQFQGVKYECLVDISKVGEYYVSLRAGSSKTGSLGFSVSTRDGIRRSITLRSLLQIQNLTATPIGKSLIRHQV